MVACGGMKVMRGGRAGVEDAIATVTFSITRQKRVVP